MGHVGEFLLILGLCPLVAAFRKEFAVVLYRVVVNVKEVLKVIEANYEILLCFLWLLGKSEHGQNGAKGYGQCFFHTM